MVGSFLDVVDPVKGSLGKGPDLVRSQTVKLLDAHGLNGGLGCSFLEIPGLRWEIPPQHDPGSRALQIPRLLAFQLAAALRRSMSPRRVT